MQLFLAEGGGLLLKRLMWRDVNKEFLNLP